MHGFDGQASMLRSILDAQEKMMEILLSLKRDTEMVRMYSIIHVQWNLSIKDTLGPQF